MIKVNPLIAMLHSTAMTPAEQSKGRYMRAPDGHAEAGSSPAGGEGGGDAAPEGEPLTTEQQLEQEFSGPDDPATPETDAKVDAEAKDDKSEGDQDPAPKGNSAQERIDQLTASRREAERDAAEARREAAELRARYEQKDPAPAESGSNDGEPDATKYEYGEADPEFIKDMSRFYSRQEYARQAQEADVRRDMEKVDTDWNARIADPAIATEFPDFQEKVTKGAEEGAWKCSPLMAIGLKTSEHGPSIAYHLATNPGEAERIASLSPVEQAREFGILEGQRIAAKPAAKVPAKVTDAPEPPSGRTRGAGGKFATEADTDDFSAFDKMADGILKKS